MKRLLEWLLASIIFVIPSNLFIKFLIEAGYVRGIFVDYLIPKLYLSQLLVIVFVILALLSKPPKLRLHSRLVMVGVVAVIFLSRQFFVENTSAAFFQVAQLLTAGLFVWTLSLQRELLKSRVVQYAFVLTVLFQSSLGLYQFFMQSELVGYRLLGEPNISASLGIVRQTLWGREVALPYGTTAHPNVLAGVLVLYILICVLYWTKEKRKNSIASWLLYLSLPVSLFCLWLTQSLAAWIGLVVGLGSLQFKSHFSVISQLIQKLTARALPIIQMKKITAATFFWIVSASCICIPLVLPLLQPVFPDSSSIDRRVLLNTAAMRMWINQPVLGVGLNQFTVYLEKYAQSSEVVRFIQPAHHVGLLWLSETGLFGLIAVILILYVTVNSRQKLPSLWLAVIPLAVLDHYLLTLSTGLFLLVISSSVFLYLRE